MPVERLRVQRGDTALPAGGLSGGSSTTTSLMSALALGCEQLREAAGAGGDALKWAFGTQFAEAHVHAETGEIRVARLTGAFVAGRILNPLTARSQLLGGMIWV